MIMKKIKELVHSYASYVFDEYFVLEDMSVTLTELWIMMI